MSKKKGAPASFESVDKVFDLLDESLRATGKMLADSEMDISVSEFCLDVDSIELPEVLRDYKSTLALGRTVLENGFSSERSQVATDTSRNLAQAARNGKDKITSEIQNRMKQDRQAAKK